MPRNVGSARPVRINDERTTTVWPLSTPVFRGDHHNLRMA